MANPAPSPLVSAGIESPDSLTALRSFLSPAIAGGNTDIVLEALASGDSYVREQTLKVFNQLFLSSASGVYLDQRASDVGIARIIDAGLSDDDFRKLALSYKNRQITLNSILSLLESLFGEEATRANVLFSASPAPELGYFVFTKDSDLVFRIDGTRTVTVPLIMSNFANASYVTNEEMAFVINKTFLAKNIHAYAKVVVDTIQWQQSVKSIKVFSKTLGVGGSVELVGGSYINNIVSADTTIANWNIDIGTEFEILAGTLPGTMRIAWTGVGTDPQFFNIKVGNFITLAAPLFNIANRGTWEIIEATNSYVEVEFSEFVPEIVTIATLYDLLISVVTKKTVFNNKNYAIATVGAPSVVTITVPPVSQLIRRDNESAGYLAASAQTDVIWIGNTQRFGNGEMSTITSSFYPFSVGDWVLFDGFMSTVNDDGIDQTGGFTAAGSDLTQARRSHTATLLDDDTVLVVGGEEAGVVLSSTELSDTTINTWTTVGALNTARSHHTAIKLDSGKVLVIGGYTNYPPTTATATCEIYDPAIQAWAVVGSMAVARAQLGCCKLRDGRILVAGGHATDDTIEIFDPSTNSWSTSTATLAEGGRLGCACTLLNDGRVLISEGVLPVGNIEYEIYSPWLDQIQSINYATGNSQVGHVAMFVEGYQDPAGSVLLIGGQNAPTAGNLFKQSKQEFVEDHLTFAVGRVDHTATMMDNNQILVVGGNATGADPSFIIDLNSGIDRYVSGGTIKATKSTFGPTAYMERHAAVKLRDNRVLIVGGEVGGLYTSGECFIYTDNIVTRSGRANGLFVTTGSGGSNINVQTGLSLSGKFDPQSVEPINGINTADGYPVTIYGVTALSSGVGSFIYDPLEGMSVTATDTTTLSVLESGAMYSTISVDSTANMPDTGFIVINYGWENQIGPIEYIAKPDVNTLTLKAGFVFPSRVEVGAVVTLALGSEAFVPDSPNLNGALYVTASTSVTMACYNLLKEIMAAGVKYDITTKYADDYGLGNSQSPISGLGKVSDLVRIYAANNIEDALTKARED